MLAVQRDTELTEQRYTRFNRHHTTSAAVAMAMTSSYYVNILTAVCAAVARELLTDALVLLR